MNYIEGKRYRFKDGPSFVVGMTDKKGNAMVQMASGKHRGYSSFEIVPVKYLESGEVVPHE